MLAVIKTRSGALKNFLKCNVYTKTLKSWVGVQRASSTLWGEGASLALVGQRFIDGVTIKMPYEVDVLHQAASHPIYSYWVG